MNIDLNVIVAWAGLIFGFGAFVKSVWDAFNDKEKLELDKSKFIADVSLEIAEKYKEEREERDREIVELKKAFNALEQKYQKEEKENAILRDRFSEAIEVVEGLTNQLVGAGIKPAYKLKE